MTPSKRTVWGLALAALALTVSACGEETGDASDGATESPETAYAYFAQAVADDDQDAFDAAVHDGYWSDLGGVQDDNAANLAVHHWQVENGVLDLPEEAPEVLVGDDVIPDEGTGDADEAVKLIGKVIGEDDLTGDDLAMVKIPAGYATRTANEADEAGCVEDEKPIDECVEDPGEAERTTIGVYLVRGSDGWKVFGTEPEWD